MPRQCPWDVTIFAKTQGLPLLPLHQDADGTHPQVDEQHAHGGVQEEVDEVPVRRGHGGRVREPEPESALCADQGQCQG